MIEGVLIVLLFTLGVWGIIRRRNLIKKVMALSIVNSAVVIAFVYLGSLSGVSAPILVGEARAIVDPVPQALMLTAIVIGICLTALALTLIYRMFRKYGTLDATGIDRIMKDGHD